MRIAPIYLALLATPAWAGPLQGDSDGSTDGSTTSTITMSATLDASSSLEIRGRGAGDPFDGQTDLTATLAFANVDVSAGTAGDQPPDSLIVQGTYEDAAAVALVSQLELTGTVSGASSGDITIKGTQPGDGVSAHYTCSPTAAQGDTDDWLVSGDLQENLLLTQLGTCASGSSTVITTDFDLALIIKQGAPAGGSAEFLIELVPTP